MPQWRHRKELWPLRRARWRWSRDMGNLQGRNGGKAPSRPEEFPDDQEDQKRPVSGRDATTTEHAVIGHLLPVGATLRGRASKATIGRASPQPGVPSPFPSKRRGDWPNRRILSGV